MNRVGLVLAGGRSSRFGREKAAALLHGQRLLLHAREALAGCAAAAVSAAPGSQAERMALDLGLTVLPDAPEHARGPLAGVAAGLAWADGLGADLLALAPCDTPRMTAAMVERMAQALRPDDTVAAAFAGEDFHALCAVLRVSAAPAIAAALAGGGHPPVRALWRRLGLTEVRFDDEAAAFANINRPEDLEGLR